MLFNYLICLCGMQIMSYFYNKISDLSYHVECHVLQFQDVRTLLGKSAKGQKVLAEYDRHQTLCSESRQTLVKIAVAQLVDDCGPLVEFLVACSIYMFKVNCVILIFQTMSLSPIAIHI